MLLTDFTDLKIVNLCAGATDLLTIVISCSQLVPFGRSS